MKITIETDLSEEEARAIMHHFTTNCSADPFLFHKPAEIRPAPDSMVEAFAKIAFQKALRQATITRTTHQEAHAAKSRLR